MTVEGLGIWEEGGRERGRFPLVTVLEGMVSNSTG